MSCYVPPHPMRDIKGSEELDEPFAPVSIGQAADRVFALAKAAVDLEPSCESPIEIDLGAHLYRDLPAGFTLHPQFRLLSFRFDFAVMVDDHAIILIECDGKEFHSTPEQMANDRRKDEAAARAGIRIIRFTGSEIFRRPAECSRKVVEMLK